MNIEEIKKSHKLLSEWTYDWTALDKGYTDKTLYINVGSNEIKS